MSHRDGSVKVVLTAAVVNFFVTLAKSAGWMFSMSPSMLAEAIHSFADTANQLLVYLGIRISRKGPTREYPAGYGQAINEMEKQIQNRFPNIKYIDLEIN